jgi:ISXO2-like transposase domain
MHARGNPYSADGSGVGYPSHHRILLAASLPGGPEQRHPTVLGGIVEADETYFLRSFKGQRTGLPRPAKKRGMPAAQRGLSAEQIPVLTAQSRSAPTVFSAILPSRKFPDVDALLAPRLAPDVLLMTDGLSAYRKISATHGLAYRAVPPHPQKKTQGMLPLNNINAYHRRLKVWMGASRASPIAIWQIISAGTDYWTPLVKHSFPSHSLPPVGAERQTQRAPPQPFVGRLEAGG